MQERLDSILDNALILGNGDINALVWTEQGVLMLMLTKNDVWDARLDAAKDPPLPTLARIKELGRAGGKISDPILPEGVAWTGPDSYHAHAYPCPRACAKLRIGGGIEKPGWLRIRAEGQHNAWQQRGNVTVMSIRGRKEASNGYAFGPMIVSTDDYPHLRSQAVRHAERPFLCGRDGAGQSRHFRQRLEGVAGPNRRGDLQPAGGQEGCANHPLHVDGRWCFGGKPFRVGGV